MDKVNFNPFSEIIIEDFLRQSDYIEKALTLFVSDFLNQNTAVTGLNVTAQASPDMTVYVKPGRIYAAGKQGELSANLTPPLAIAAAHPTYDRIDRICAQYYEVEDTPETRNVMIDTVSRQITQQSVMTRIAGTVNFMVVNGVAAPGPAAPTVPDGWISLAQVRVRAATTSVLQSDILDERPTLKSLLTHAHSGGNDGAQIDYSSIKNTPSLTGYVTAAALAALFDDNTGHRHTAGAGDGPQLNAADILNNNISGLATTILQDTLGAIYTEALKKGSSSARNNLISGPLSAKGLARLIRDRYSEDLCYGGTALSGGDYLTYKKENAFDGNSSTYWDSAQVAANQNGVSWIGYDFGANNAKHIRKIKAGMTTQISALSIKVQNSTDGASWVDVTTTTMTPGDSFIYLPASASCRYWRILAAGNVVSGMAWAVHTVEMYELLDAGLADNDLAIQAGGLISFAAGQGQYGNVDYMYYIPTNAPLAGLPAADANTIPLAYTDDLCNGGTAISGGDYSGYPAANAFDNIINVSSNYWQSSQIAANQANVSYIGYDFGVAKAIRQMYVVQSSSTNNQMTNLKVQYSSNGTSWNDATSVQIPTGTSTFTINIPAVGAYRYWRLLATANCTNGYAWIILDMNMCEALQTYYIYVTRAADGSVTYGYTRQKPKQGKPSQSVVTSQGTYTGNLCGSGAPISSGDYNSAYLKANAFDGSYSTYWQSSQVGSGINGIAYIGYDFGSAKNIRRIYFQQVNNVVTALKVQYSSDRATWNDAVSTSVPVEGTIDLPNIGAYQYWRLLAGTNSIVSNGGWTFSEIQMMGYIDPVASVSTDDLVYSDNVAVGGAAISGGDVSGTPYPKEYAFDGNPTTNWASVQGGAYNTRWIGYDFGVARKIKKAVVNTVGFTTSIKIQNSTDGSAWNDQGTYDVTSGINTFIVANPTAARYWRFLGNSTTLVDGSTSLSVSMGAYEITMHEICTDLTHYDQYVGVSRYYDGNTWTNVVRKFLGEAVLDSAGKIVSYKTYDYGMANIVASPAVGPDDVVTLGQFPALLQSSGWEKLPNGRIKQWGVGAGTTTGTLITYPAEFPHGTLSIVFGQSASNSTPFASNPTTKGFTMYTVSANGSHYWEATGW